MKIMPNECPHCGSIEMYDINPMFGEKPYCADCGNNIEKVDCPTAIKKPITLLARKVIKKEEVTTIIDGEKETKNVAEIGDYIITGTKGENYVIKEEKLLDRYEVETINDKHNVYDYVNIHSKPVEIECVENKINFSFIASWGEEMIAKGGDYLVFENNKLSYRIEREIFFNSYTINEK